MGKKGIYNSGLESGDWYQMSDAVLCASFNKVLPSEGYDKLPQYLKDHEVGELIAAYLRGGSKRCLDKPVAKLAGGSDQA